MTSFGEYDVILTLIFYLSKKVLTSGKLRVNDERSVIIDYIIFFVQKLH